MSEALPASALDTLFYTARTYSHWQDRPVTDEHVATLYDMVRLGPTSANCSPGRFVFLRSAAAKARLAPALSSGNREKTLNAPLTAIVAWDSTFYHFLPELFPWADARAWFTGSETLVRETAMRNCALQAGYLISACRALGLDCGPMSGFDNQQVDAEFFAGTSWRSDLLINIGYGDAQKLHTRLPRLAFDQACQLL